MIVLALGLALCKEQGVLKSEFLRTRSLASPHHVMKLSPAEIQEYVLTFPRPYDVVIYFSSKTSKLSREMQEEFYYLADLYVGSGCLYPSVEDGKVKSAVYFLEVEYGLSTRFFFDLFEFSSAPNLVVSNPRMAILSQAESKRYLKSVKWEISYNDGHVTTHKMLEFTNQRTLRDVVYRPTLLAMLQSVVLFLAVSLGGYYLVTRLRSFYLNPKVWFGGTLLLYFVCTSGIIFVIHQNVPSVGYDKEGNVQVFSNELHMQYGMQGFIIAACTLAVGACFILIAKLHKLSKDSANELIALAVLAFLLVLLVRFIEESFKGKSHYRPQFLPPGHYRQGSIFHDQGHST